MADELIRQQYLFSGLVQGVGFRWRARQAAQAAGVSGWVRNNWDGTVTMELQGSRAGLDRVLAALDRGLYIRIEAVDVRTIPPEPEERGFKVRDDCR